MVRLSPTARLVACVFSFASCAPAPRTKLAAPAHAPARLFGFTVHTTPRAWAARPGTAPIFVTATWSGGGDAKVALRTHGRIVKSVPIRVDDEVAIAIEREGDYVVELQVDGSALADEPLMVRPLACVGGERRLVVEDEIRPRIRQGEHGNELFVPRWNASDRDPSYVVEWFHDGKLVFETRGRDPRFDHAADRIERAKKREDLKDVCAATWGESYRLPQVDGGPTWPTGVGRWEVRIHREGFPSLATTFESLPSGAKADGDQAQLAQEYLPGKEKVFFQLQPIETPKSILALLARIPSACQRRCGDAIDRGDAATPGKYADAIVGSPKYKDGACIERTPPLPHVAHLLVPYPRAATPDEVRAIVRSSAAVDARVALNEKFFDADVAGDHAEFVYDPSQSRDANLRRRQAFDARDHAAQKSEEEQRKAIAMPLVPALEKAIAPFGTRPWSAEEIPADPTW